MLASTSTAWASTIQRLLQVRHSRNIYFKFGNVNPLGGSLSYQPYSAPRPTSTTRTGFAPRIRHRALHQLIGRGSDDPLLGSRVLDTSSERPLTVQPSAPTTSSPTSTSVQYAVPGNAIPVTDSPVESAPNTIEHVESLCDVVYSLDGSSSEDIELLESSRPKRWRHRPC